MFYSYNSSLDNDNGLSTSLLLFLTLRELGGSEVGGISAIMDCNIIG
jgi:hypothetical protein